MGIFSCNKKEPIVKDTSFIPLQKDTLVNILVDCQLTEAAILMKQNKQQHVGFYSRFFYDYTMKKHHISRKILDKNIRYYKTDPDELGRIYAQVLDKLSRLQSETGNKIIKEK